MLVNGRSGDPALYIETLFEKRAIMLDLGDISSLSPRRIQRLEHVFVSHAHIDHFIGFDRLLRVLVGRDKTVCLYGPEGFIERFYHKLASYRWNLVDRFIADLTFVVTELDADQKIRIAELRLKNGFAIEPADGGQAVDGLLCADLHSESRPLSWNIALPAWHLRSRRRLTSMSGRIGSANWDYRLGRGCANSSERSPKTGATIIRSRSA